MTGLWQVSGRNEVDYRRRVALDVLYVRNRSLANNIKILFRTIPAVLLRSGAR
jgi:lipopolysaccharide/colanic/teichoic acid biosynthesis glycosyltransferase